jgi:hypothetical protein
MEAAEGTDKGALAAAYVAACSEVKDALKNAKNPHLGNNYADLSSVLDTVRPIFAKYKLWLLQAPGECEVSADGMNAKVSLHGVLMHASGGQLAFTTQVPFPAEVNKKTGLAKITAQGLGSAITYGRRYQWVSVAGITQVDDDGNDASARNEVPAEANDGESESVLSGIAATKSIEELKPLRDAAQRLGKKTADAYMAKRAELLEKK